MQQPLIRFNGEEHKVLNINWRDGKPCYAIALVSGEAVEFHSEKSFSYSVNHSGYLCDLEKNLIFESENQNKLAESVKRKIEAHEEVICDMSIEFVESFRRARKEPFANHELFESADLIEKLGYVVDGLYEALNVITQKEVE